MMEPNKAVTKQKALDALQDLEKFEVTDDSVVETIRKIRQERTAKNQVSGSTKTDSL